MEDDQAHQRRSVDRRSIEVGGRRPVEPTFPGLLPAPVPPIEPPVRISGRLLAGLFAVAGLVAALVAGGGAGGKPLQTLNSQFSLLSFIILVSLYIDMAFSRSALYNIIYIIIIYKRFRVLLYII